MDERVSITIEEGVAHVVLNRPDKMNALDHAMFAGIVDAGERLRTDPAVRAVVISGAGRAFCAGLDMQNFSRMEQEGSSKPLFADDVTTRTHGIANTAQRVAMVWRRVPVPVIAAVHGVAFGGGLQIALGADMRFVTSDLRMSVMEIKWGLVPDMAGIVLMRELARPDVVRDLTFSGRIFSGQEALAYGFATRVCDDPLQVALQAAQEIAQKSPSAIRAAKRLLNASLEQDAAALLMAESVEQRALIGSEHQKEAVRANMEKRVPIFT